MSLILNQNIKIVNDKIISGRNESTPGIYGIFNVKPNIMYKIKFLGYSPGNKKGKAWIATRSNKKLFYETIDEPESEIFYENENERYLKIGILFSNPRINDHFYLKEISITPLKYFIPTNSSTKIKKISKENTIATSPFMSYKEAIYELGEYEYAISENNLKFLGEDFQYEIISLTKEKQSIEMTCALPMYESIQSFWMALDSISNQKNINFGWELVIAEEIRNRVDPEKIIAYLPKLKEIGCHCFKYLGLKSKISLSKKWLIMSQIADLSSIGFMLHASDDYNQPNRFYNTYKLFMQGADWVQTKKCLFYDIRNRKCVLFQALPRKRTALFMSIRTNIVQKVKNKRYVNKCVDNFLMNSCLSVKRNMEIVYDEDLDDWKYAMCTDGFNKISKERKGMMARKVPPFGEYKYNFKDYFPKEFLEKLEKILKN